MTTKNMKTLAKVEQFHAKNQFLIKDGTKTIFPSYNSIIAVQDQKGNITLDADKWDYSQTTGKYRNKFLCEDKKETERKIKAAIYKLENLN